MNTAYPGSWNMWIKLNLTLIWLFFAMSGVAGLIVQAGVLAPHFGYVFPAVLNVIFVLTCGASAIGTALGRWQWEWVAAWFAAASMLPVLYELWFIGLTTEASLQWPLFLTGTFLCILLRAVIDSAHAAKVRTIRG